LVDSEANRGRRQKWIGLLLKSEAMAPTAVAELKNLGFGEFLGFYVFLDFYDP